MRGEDGRIDAHARALDLDEHRDERLLQLVVDALQIILLQKLDQRPGKLQREIGALAGVIERALDRDVCKRDGLRAPSADLLFAERLVADVLDRQILERVRHVGIDEIAGDHHVGSRDLRA